jgi:hypothetical protein
MVGVESKESTTAKLSKGVGQNLKLRPETHFSVTAQFIISLSFFCIDDGDSPTISRQHGEMTLKLSVSELFSHQRVANRV